ncbi:MAG TPA: hypothetical protein H9830_14195 [Candidatus Agrococcus pullicola]|uniref:Uncharacterized protein n=1 Tax=Candidatus Agrococcus pullicola TaxID=2838429 RepID=A0A9D2CAZ2_9MICO|nr:hypothetical protein [Candidatus Agrococcus pullicola]
MDFTAGLGTSAVFVLAAIVWLAYLVPVWAKRRELSTAEIEAARLQRTLRALSETTEAGKALEFDLRAKDIARTRKLMEKEVRLREARARADAVAKAREIDEQIKKIEREVKVVVRSSTTRMARLRRTKLACTMTAAAALTGLAAGILLPGLWVMALAAGALLLVAIAGLVMVNRSSRQVSRVASAARRETDSVLRETGVVEAKAEAERKDAEQHAQRASEQQEETEEHMRSRSWTPRNVPPQRSAARSREEYAATMAERIQEAIRREVSEQSKSLRTQESFNDLMGVDELDSRIAASTSYPSHATGASHSAPVRKAARRPDAAPTVAPSLSEVDAREEDEMAFDVHAAFARRLG